MKKVLVVAALLGVMLIVGSLKQAGVSSAATLAGIGFVMLAAYAVAELGKSLTLPQVTGYIVAGVVLGPSVGGIISGEVVGEMRMFNTLALGLIATSAGLELDVRQIVRLRKTLLLTTLIKVLVGCSLVAGTLLAIESSLGSLGLQSQSEIVTLALIMGVLSIGTSPSISLAVLSETRAKGRLSDLVLGAAVFKDLVVIVGLAIAVAVGRVMLNPDAELDSSVLTHVVVELVGSMLAGGVVGLIFILYVRFIRAEMLLFVAAMILVVAELCRAFHLELLLVFIAAGFAVRNFSKFEHDLMRPLQLVALPVFVVFFANAGASVDLVTTWKILPLALALCAARAASYVLASRLGGKWAGESEVIQRHAWLAYLPQAGVTLGLVGLAGLQVPELVTPITNTGMAVVALNLLVGPITLRRALGLAGEIPKVDAESGAVNPRLTAGEPSPAHLSPAPIESSTVSVAALPQSLRHAHATMADSMHDVLERFAVEQRPHLPTLPELHGEVPELEAFRQIVVAHRSAYQALYADLTSILGQVPRMVRLEPLEQSLPTHGKKRAAWSVRRSRTLPLRRLARIALGPAIARHVARSFENGLRDRTDLLPVLSELDERMHLSREPVLPPDLDGGLVRLAELMRDAGTRRLPAGRLRYSTVEPQIRRQLQSLTDGTEAELTRLTRAAWGSALLELWRLQITTLLRGIVTRCVVEPAKGTAAKVNPAVELLTKWLDARRGELEAHPLSGPGLMRLRSDFDKLTTSAFGEASREFRAAATVRTTLVEMKASVAAIPRSVDCLFLEPEMPLAQGKIQSVPLRAHVDTLIRHIMPPLDLAVRSISTALSQLPRRVDDAIQPEWTLLEAQVDLASPHEIKALATERLAQARRRVEGVTGVTRGAVQTALDALDASLESACVTFDADVLPGPSTQGSRDVRLQNQLARLRRVFQEASNTLRLALHGSTPLADAAAVQRSLRRSQPSPVPEVVDRWFASVPVSDERIFVAHRRLLDHILDAESSRAETGQASVLIIGSKGAGKSSLLNMCELELPSTTHLRLHASDFGRDTTLLEALGSLLECPPTHAGVSRHLKLRNPAIFVDDLGSWISSSPHRQLELQRLLHLIAETRSFAFWLVSVEVSVLHLFSEMECVEEVFTHLVRLPPLSLAEVKLLVEARLALLDLEVTFQPSRWTQVLDRLPPAREGDTLYRALWSTSAGVPGRVVALCRQAFSMQGQKLSFLPETIAAPTPPAYSFSEVQLAILTTLHRYGPQTALRLTRDLAVSLEQLQRSVAFLSACGLVGHVDEGHALSISPPAEWVVFEALLSAGLAVSQ